MALIKPKVISEVLAQANTGGVQKTLLLNTSGSLISFSGGPSETEAKITAAIVSNLWIAYDRHTGQGLASRGASEPEGDGVQNVEVGDLDEGSEAKVPVGVVGGVGQTGGGSPMGRLGSGMQGGGRYGASGSGPAGRLGAGGMGFGGASSNRLMMGSGAGGKSPSTTSSNLTASRMAGSSNTNKENAGTTKEEGLRHVMVMCEHGTLSITKVSNMLLCLVASEDVQCGILKAKTLALKSYLEKPLQMVTA
ncbi:Ragulator complex protein lamtor2 [Chytridiales sp. JEL 0842]|nr:Ragulator complex protein lamtor2 [Chytridiales sp. JEL 0842]